MAYPTLDELRAIPDLDNEDLYSDDMLAGLAFEFAKLVERARGVAFGPRERTATLRRRGAHLRFPDIEVIAVTAATVDAVTVSPTGYGIVPDRLGDYLVAGPTATTWPWGATVVTYTHGTDEVPPGIARACGLFVWREALATSTPNTGNAYLTQNPDLGVIERQSTQDWDATPPRFTGWMDVDKLIREEPDRRPSGLV